ncbi:MAG: hypothetical protein D3914_02635 [Candidatus Electrothrix sp. LOE2]|nr:hypothetical protein [Candidatus Electrothrix sp. LOE2]
MNPLIEEYFDETEVCLIANRTVSSYTLVRREIAVADGKLRAKAVLSDDSMLEFFLYIRENDRQISREKYSFHWQDAQGNLIRRWDNAPHHPALDNAPHHLHLADGSTESVANVPDLPYVLKNINNLLLEAG